VRDEFLSIEELAARYDASVSWVYRAMRCGYPRPTHQELDTGKKLWRIADVERFEERMDQCEDVVPLEAAPA
jgi:hypothetical protein